MSINSRYRDRKYNSTDNDRLYRALSQPVQAWDKKWAPHSRSRNVQIYKWVKSDRQIVYEDEEEELEDKIMTEAPTEAEAAGDPSKPTESNEATSMAPSAAAAAAAKTSSSGLDNSALPPSLPTPAGLQGDLENDEERTHTPKLDEVSDVEPDQKLVPGDDEEQSNMDDLNDAAKHPADIPHANPNVSIQQLTGDVAAQSVPQNGSDASP